MNSFLLPSPALLATRVMDSKNATEPMIEMTSFKPAFSNSKKGSAFPLCTPEEEGIPSSLLCAFLDKLHGDPTLNVHNVLVARHGRILCSASFGAQDLGVWKHTFSACKSIVSLAIGMLIDDGLCSLREKVSDMFLKELGPITKLKLKDLCVEDLLTMRATLQFAEADSMTTTEWLHSFLNSATKGELGKTFKYNSLNTYLLAAIVVKKTGKSLSEFLDERLFAPLGIVNYYWEKSPENIEKGGWGLYLLPSDLLKIVHTVLEKGIYEGKQILPVAYLKAATSKHVDVVKESQHFDYGYQIWTGKNSDTFLFNGMLGQNTVAFRRSGVIVLVNSGNGEFFHTSNYFRYLLEMFDRDFKDTLPKNSYQQKELQKKIRELSLYTPKKKGLRERLLDTLLYHKNYIFDEVVGEYALTKGDEKAVGLMPLILQGVQNEYTKGFSSVCFEKRDGMPHLVYREKNAEYEIPLGFDRPIQKHFMFGKTDFLVAITAKFRYNEDDRLVLIVRVDFLETPFSRVLKFIFKPNGELVISYSELPGEEFVSEAVSDVLKQISEIPVPLLSNMIDRFGEDYAELKLKKAFSPTLFLKKQISRE